MSRIATIISTQGDQRETLETSARTWGELRAEIDSDQTSFRTEGAKVMIRGIRDEINSDSYELPTGDFSMFFTPSKIKSGKITA